MTQDLASGPTNGSLSYTLWNTVTYYSMRLLCTQIGNTGSASSVDAGYTPGDAKHPTRFGELTTFPARGSVEVRKINLKEVWTSPPLLRTWDRKLAGHCRVVVVTWSHPLNHYVDSPLSVSVPHVQESVPTHEHFEGFAALVDQARRHRA